METAMNTFLRSGLRAGVIGLALATTAGSAALAQAAPPAADTMFRATTLNLAAYGETKTEPDMATINLGVMTQAKTAAEAMQANATRMNQVMAALQKARIAAKDIQDHSFTRMVLRIRYKTLTGDRERSEQVNIALFPQD